MIEEIAHVIFGPIGAVTAVVLLLMSKTQYRKVRDHEAAIVVTRRQRANMDTTNNGKSSKKDDSNENEYTDLVFEPSQNRPRRPVAAKKSSALQNKTASKEAAVAHISKAKGRNAAKTKKTTRTKPIRSAKKGKKAA